MKLNNKGFTMVELLASVAILSILMGAAVAGVTKYQEKARQEAYEAMESSAYAAAQNYIQKHGSVIPLYPSSKKINIDTLVEEGLLNELQDPTAKDFSCNGTVDVSKIKGSGSKLDEYKYVVKINCEQYDGNKTFTS